MFLALRDLRFAKGRFALIVTVVALMTMLVGFLTSLTGGLAMQNISAVLQANPARTVLSVEDGKDATFANSRITRDQYDTWNEGASNVTALGISSVLLEAGDVSESGVLFAADGAARDGLPQVSDGSVVLSEDLASELRVKPGDTLDLAGGTLTVQGVVASEYYSHRPVAWASLPTWHSYLETTHQPDAYASVLLVGENGATAPLDTESATLDVSAGTQSQTLLPSLMGIGSFRSEIGSLAMMIGLLVLISTLVIGVFFLVWSMQRQRDIAVLKALGARTTFLAKDALGQALIVMLIGAGIGVSVTALAGYFASQVMPFVMNAATLALPPVAMTLAGLLGALVSMRAITTVDPNQALQASAA